MDEPSSASGVRIPRRTGLTLRACIAGIAVAVLTCASVSAQQINRLPPVYEAWSYPAQQPAAPFAPPAWATSGGSIGVYDRLVRATAMQDAEPPADPAPPADPNDDFAPRANAGGDQSEPRQPGEIGQKPVTNTLQFLRTQDVLLAPGAWQADTGLVYTNFDQLIPVGVSSGGPSLTGVVQGHVRRRILYTPLALRYGITKNIQFFSFMPFGWSNTQISTIGSTLSSNQGGQGDLTAGLNLHLLEACDDRPDVIATIGFTAPAGPYSAPLFNVVPGGNLGQGFWALQGNLLFIHRYDPIIAFYGFGYRHLFQRSFSGVEFQAGEQISYQFGVGFSANDRVTLSATFLGWYITSSVQNFVGIPGTNFEPLEMRFAATIVRREKIIEPFAILGVTQFAPAAQIGITVTYY